MATGSAGILVGHSFAAFHSDDAEGYLAGFYRCCLRWVNGFEEPA